MPLIESHQQVEYLLQTFGHIKLSRSFTIRRSHEKALSDNFPLPQRLFMLSALDEALQWQELARSMSGTLLPIPCGHLSGNLEVYSALSKILELDYDSKPDVSLFRYFASISSTRALTGVSQSSLLNITTTNDLHKAIVLSSLNEQLHVMLNKSTSYAEGVISGKFKSSPNAHVKSEKCDIQMCSTGSIFILTIKSEHFIFTHDHMMRLLEMTLHYRNYLLLSVHTLGNDDNYGQRLLRKFTSLGIRYPNKLGEGVKAARNRLVWRLNRDEPMGASSESMLLNSYSDWKQSLSEKVLDIIEDSVNGVAEKITMSYFFKYVSHSDFDVRACFETTLGVRDCNPVDENALLKLTATLKRSLFIASVEAGEPLRVISGDEYLVRQSKEVSPDTRQMSSVPIERWQESEFDISPKCRDYMKVDLRVKDKSHAKIIDPRKAKGQMSLDKDYLLGNHEKKYKLESLFESDLKLKYSSEGFPTQEESRTYVETIIKKHLDKERRLGHRMSSRELQEFFEEDPTAFHLVATEGKYGELHKEVTRMFYLANVHVKQYLSSVERLVKTLTMKQMGNSITKSYASKENDLRALAHGSVGADAEVCSVCLSFDMSEFSKKFPGENCDALGSILASLTGDEMLSHLSVVFRSSVVAHNTRGFTDSFAGVTGGFEGFLNFGWTTLHVAIMILALREAGVKGFVLAYSDDGVLYFLVKGPLVEAYETIRVAVIAIQKAYADLGLVFHIGKTLVSSTTFEYLGDIGDDGRFIDTSAKPLSSFGVTESGEGITTFGSVIDSYIGQAAACVEVSFPAFLLDPFLYSHVYRKLQRASPMISIDDALGIMIMPKSVGGLGVSDYMSYYLTATREQSSELLADLTLLQVTHPKLVRKVSSFIINNSPDPSDVLHKFLMGASVASTVPDMSGNSILAAAGNKLREKVGLPEASHPLTPLRCAQLRQVIKCLDGFLPRVMGMIVEATPEMSEYQRIMQEGKSKGATKVLGKDYIRRMQSKDTRNVKKCIEQYRSLRYSDYDLADLHRHIIRQLKETGFTPPDPSLRLLFSISDKNNSNITVITDVSNVDESGLGRRTAMTIGNLSYLHPKPSTRDRADRLIFEAESSKDNAIPNKLLQLISTLIKRNPEFTLASIHICGILGSPMPNFLEADPLDQLRFKALKGKPDYTLNISPLYDARSSVLPDNYVTRLFSTEGSGDRTTLEFFSKCVGYDEFCRRGGCSRPVSIEKFRVHLKILGDYRLRGSYITNIAELPKHSLKFRAQDKDSKNMIEALRKDIEDQNTMRRLIEVPNVSFDELSVLVGYFSSKMSNKIIRRLNYHGTYDNLVPFNQETTSERLNVSIHKDIALRLFMWAVYGYEQIDWEDRRQFLIESLDDLGPTMPTSIKELISTVTPELVASRMVLDNLSNSLFSSGKVLVVDTGKLHSKDPVASTISHIISNTIREIYRIAHSSESGWTTKYRIGSNPAALKASIDTMTSFSIRPSSSAWPRGVPISIGRAAVDASNLGFDTDYILDSLSIGYDSTRRSSHRKSSYNRTTFEIIAYMFIYLMNSDDAPVTDVEDDDLSEVSDDDPDPDVLDVDYTEGDKHLSYYKLPEAAIDNYLQMSNLEITDTRGRDHLGILCSHLPHKINLRLNIYRRNRKLKVSIPANTYEDCYTEAVRMQHFYNQTIENLIGSKVHSLDVKHLETKSISYDTLMNYLPATDENLCGAYVRGISMGLTDIAGQAMWANALIFMEAEGIGSVELLNGMPMDVVNKKLKEVVTEVGSMAVAYCEAVKHGMTLINEGYSTSAGAAASYAALTSAYPSSLSIICDEGYYKVLGVVMFDSEYPPYLSEIDATSLFPVSEAWSDMLACGDSERLVSDLMITAGAYTKSRAYDVIGRRFLESGGKTTRHMYTPTRVIADIEMIVAASSLSSSGSTIGSCFWGSCLLNAFLSGEDYNFALDIWESNMGILQTQQAIMMDDGSSRRQISTADITRRRALDGIRLEASSIRGYFAQNPVGTPLTSSFPTELLVVPNCDVPEMQGYLNFTVVHRSTMPIESLIAMRDTLNYDDDPDALTRLLR